MSVHEAKKSAPPGQVQGRSVDPSSHGSNGPARASKCPFAPFVAGAPLLGNSLDFLRDTTGLLVSAYRRYGPVFRIRMMWLRFTVILGFEARQFMIDGGERHLNRHPVFDPVGEQLGSADFALALSGEKHTQLRRLLQVAYSREVASPHVPQFIEAVREIAREWREGEALPVFESVQKMAFQQYCRVMGNCSLLPHYRDCRAVTDMNMSVGGRVLPLWMFHWPPYRAARRRVLQLMSGVVEEHRQKGSGAERPADIVDTLMAVRFPDGRPMTQDEVMGYAMYGFAGSCSYMGRLVSFMLYELFRNPRWLPRLREEVDAAFARGLRDAADLAALPLLRAFYNETLRFHPVSQGMPYVAKENFEFMGHEVEQGSLVVLSQLPMLFSEEPFREPEKFDPERCLEPRNEHRRLGAFNPFGMHHRTCAAMGLVELMSITMVATLLRDFELEMSPADYRLRTTVNPLPAPDGRFAFKLRRRSPAASATTVPSAPVLSEEVCLAAFPGAEKDEVLEALQQGTLRSFAAGETILRQGDPADAFYVLTEGRVEVLREIGSGRVERVAVLGPGDYFGEIGIVCNVPRTATVKVLAEADARALVLSAEAFRRVVAESDMVSNEIARVIRKRTGRQSLEKLVAAMTEEEFARRLPSFHRQELRAGEVAVAEGDPADRFYVIHRGRLDVRRGQTGGEQWLASLGPGNYFGETGLLHQCPRNATVAAAAGEPAVVYHCGRAAFDSLVREAGGSGGDLAQALSNRLGSAA